MPTLLYTFLLAIVSIFSYVWVTNPDLKNYTLQLFAFGIVLFFISKKSRGKKVALATNEISFELLILMLCILVFIGTNQMYPALLYPVLTIVLFFFVFFSTLFLAIVSSSIIALFILATQTFTHISDYSLLCMIPILFILFQFTKQQYDTAKNERSAISVNEDIIESLAQKNAKLESFIAEYVKPKMNLMQELASKPDENCEILQSQLALIETEIDKQLEDTKSSNT